MYKVKCYVLSLFTLISTYPYLTPVGWMVHVECREKKSLTTYIDHKYDFKLSDLKVIIDDREFSEESFDPDTKTLYLSPLILDNR